jgi:DNA polymerase-3 subunit epsilon
VNCDLKDFPGPWHEHPVAVIDFETTGADPETCAPVEIAVVRFEKGRVVGSWSTLLFPGRPIPAEATAIHGITDHDVANARTAAALARILDVNAAGLLRGAIPCGYNGSVFDRVVMHRHAVLSTLPALAPDWPWLDPLVAVRHIDKYVKGKQRHTLAVTCKRHGIELPNAHRALADAEATGKLLFNSKSMRGLLGDLPIADVLQHQERRAKEQVIAFKAWLAKQPKGGG